MQQENNRITLLISGNQYRSAGFQPIITTGQFILQLSYQGYPGMDMTQYYYVLKITNDYTQYTLVHNKITSADGVGNTMLNISIAIPAGYQLQNGVSVLTLLDEIREAFTTLYMEPTLGIEGGYTYKRLSPDKSVFEEILSRYPLEPTYIHQCVNIGSRPGILLIPREQAELLFCDVQYPEFRNYSEIIVSNEADSSFYEGYIINKLHNGMGIQIPNNRHFRLYINNQEWNWPVADPFNERTVVSHTKVYGLDTNTYEEEITSFTINELLNGSGPSNVNIDVENQVISCTINKPNLLNRPKAANRPKSGPKSVPQPRELKLSIKILNCPTDVPSFPATLLIESQTMPPQQYPVEFTRSRGHYFCETILNPNLSNQQVMIKIISNGNLEMYNPIKRILNDNSNALSVEFEKYFKTASSFATTINRNKTPILAIGSFIIAALIGGIIYLGIRGNNNINNVAEPVATPQPNEKITPHDDIAHPRSLAHFISASEKALAEDGLTFATVEKIWNNFNKFYNIDSLNNQNDIDTVKIQKINNEIEKYGKDKFDNFIDKIKTHNDLVEGIKGKYEILKRYANERNTRERINYNEYIDSVHQKYLSNFCRHFEEKYRTKNERENNYLKYKDHINKYKDFETLFDRITKAENESQDPDANQGQGFNDGIEPYE